MKAHQANSDNIPLKVQIATVAALLILAGCLIFFEQIRSWYEIGSLALFPSAQKAFSYGERHFNSEIAGAYNIGLADRFFAKAEELDPSLPYLYHEQARIAFIRGKLNNALLLINKQIETHGTSTPNSYYIRGLILGYMGRYTEATWDYQTYLKYDPKNWAGLNDYAWILIKAKRYNEAAGVAALGLEDSPDNPWLLNSYAIASSELGHNDIALEAISRAAVTVSSVGEDEWLHAYPGNDPKIAGQGMTTLAQSIADNMQSITQAAEKKTVQ